MCVINSSLIVNIGITPLVDHSSNLDINSQYSVSVVSYTRRLSHYHDRFKLSCDPAKNNNNIACEIKHHFVSSRQTH